MHERLSERDCTILNYLLDQGLENYSKMSRATGLPASTIYDRIKSLRARGVIKKMCPVLDHEKLGFRIFAALEIEVAGMREIEPLKRKYEHIASVIGLFKMSGNYDLLALVLVQSPEELEELIKKILEEPEVKDVHGNLGMKSYKFSQSPFPIKL